MIKLGINRTISIEDYHADRDFLSSSSIKEAKKSLKHFEYYLKEKNQERKSHFDFGNAFELALMDCVNSRTSVELSDFGKYVAILDDSQKPKPDKDFRTKENAVWKEEFFLENQSKYIINKAGSESFETIERMIESCSSQAYIRSLLEGSEYQTSIFWQDAQSFIKLKTRPDCVNVSKKCIIDIKSTKDGSPESFSKDCANYNYPLQAIIQMQGVLASGLLNDIEHYYWLAVEKSEPFNAQLYEFQKSDWEMMSIQLEFILSKIKRATTLKKYEGYFERSDSQTGVLGLELPMWYKL